VRLPTNMYCLFELLSEIAVMVDEDEGAMLLLLLLLLLLLMFVGTIKRKFGISFSNIGRQNVASIETN
jgi:hypothetical protein